MNDFGLRRLSSKRKLGAMPGPSLPERVDIAFERHRALREQWRTHVSRAQVETGRSERLFAEIEALRERLRLKPWARLNSAMQAIELSEAYGSLQERTAILLLTDALWRADESLEAMAFP